MLKLKIELALDSRGLQPNSDVIPSRSFGPKDSPKESLDLWRMIRDLIRSTKNLSDDF